MRLLLSTAAALVATIASAQDAAEQIRMFCAAKWATDFEMQEYCVGKQVAALNSIVPVAKSDLSTVEKTILGQCLVDWKDASGTDWEMVEYCYQQQHGAYSRLRNK